jgi:hypothetical protein
MCWNADISLNTFLFGCFSLVFIFLSNTFSKYKLKEFENPLVYLFLFLIVIMQLIEFFMWKNLKNKSINRLLSSIIYMIISLQPLTLIFMIHQSYIKYICLFFYFILQIGHNIYKSKHPNTWYASVGADGHLIWTNYSGNDMFALVFLLFYILPLIFIGNNTLTIFILGLLFVSLINYYKYYTFHSMWCWLCNIIFLYFLVDILLIKPFNEYNSLC